MTAPGILPASISLWTILSPRQPMIDGLVTTGIVSLRSWSRSLGGVADRKQGNGPPVGLNFLAEDRFDLIISERADPASGEPRGYRLKPREAGGDGRVLDAVEVAAARSVFCGGS